MSTQAPPADPLTGVPPVLSAAAPSPPSAPRRPALVIDGLVQVPAGIDDLEAFRRWMRLEEDYPRRVRLGWLAGTLWVDLTREQLYTHNQVKEAVGRVLGTLVDTSGRGLYIPDGMLLSNPEADLSTAPDGSFVSSAALESGRVREVAGRHAGVVELEGSPEMVLEVVSDSSVEKDTVLLPELYHRAGIQEFWRVDARGELRFEILRRADTGFVPAQEPDGWWRSEVFGRSFHLTQSLNSRGQPRFTLHAREMPATPD